MAKSKSSVPDEDVSGELVSYTVRQAAAVLKLHPESVRGFLRQERIHGFRVGKRWRISGSVLASLFKNGVPLASGRGGLS